VERRARLELGQLLDSVFKFFEFLFDGKSMGLSFPSNGVQEVALESSQVV